MGDTLRLLQLVDGFARFIDMVKRLAVDRACDCRCLPTSTGLLSLEAYPAAQPGEAGLQQR
jgi:hypothetical protein